MAKQPLKKKEIKKFDTNALKKKLGLAVESSDDINKSNADKPLDWIVMPKAFQDALKLPGFPIGYFSGIMGWSDTGKSTLKNCAIAQAQKQGILPVIFETEGNFDFQHAIDCGMELTPVEADVEVINEETGEMVLERRVIDYEGDYILLDNGSKYYLYKKSEEKKGISCIVTFGDAFGFKMGTFIYEVKNAMASIEFTETDITEGSIFFADYLSSGTALTTEIDEKTVVFIFQEGELYATAMYKTNSWK